MKILNYSFIFIAVIIWAGAIPVIKLVLQDVNPFLFLILRFGIVCLVCLPLILAFLYRSKYNFYDWINIFVFSFTSQISLIILFLGIEMTSVSDAIIISMLSPILTIAGGHFFFREKINLVKEIGILIAVLGSVLVTIEPLFSATHGTINQRILGNLLIILHAVLNTIWIFHSKLLFSNAKNVFSHHYTLLKKKFQLHSYNEIELNILSFLVTFLVLLPIYLYNRANFNIEIMEMTLPTYLGILYMAILSSIVAYITFSIGQSKLKVSEVSILSYSTPLFSLPISFLLLGEIPNTVSIIGLAVIFFGIMLSFKN